MKCVETTDRLGIAQLQALPEWSALAADGGGQLVIESGDKLLVVRVGLTTDQTGWGDALVAAVLGLRFAAALLTRCWRSRSVPALPPDFVFRSASPGCALATGGSTPGAEPHRQPATSHGRVRKTSAE